MIRWKSRFSSLSCNGISEHRNPRKMLTSLRLQLITKPLHHCEKRTYHHFPLTHWNKGTMLKRNETLNSTYTIKWARCNIIVACHKIIMIISHKLYISEILITENLETYTTNAVTNYAFS